MSGQYQNEYYSNRRSDMSEKHLPEIPQRKPTRREERARGSAGTVSTMMSSASSTGRESAATHVTEGPAYSKKIVVVGDGGCGKTCLLISYSQGYFPEVFSCFLQADGSKLSNALEIRPNSFRELHHIPNPCCKRKDFGVSFVGYCRTRRIRSPTPTIIPRNRPPLRLLRYRLPQLSRECYGQGRRVLSWTNSTANTSKWYPEVLHFCPYTPLILVGLKSDLRTKRTCIDLLKTQGLTPVTREQGMNVAQKMGARYMECSSKEMTGVEEIFTEAINTVVANDRTNQPQDSEGGQSGVGMRKKKKRNCRFL